MNTLRRTLQTVLLAVTVGVATISQAQAWADSYQKALDAANKGDWAAARDAFKEAATDRASDEAKPTSLPGPITEPVRWRGGAPYSPNFGAAYSAYALAKKTSDKAEKDRLYSVAIEELAALVEQGQVAPETANVLAKSYEALGKKEEAKKANDLKADAKWKVDTAFVSADDQVAPVGKPANGSNVVVTTKNGSVIKGEGTGTYTIVNLPAENVKDYRNFLPDTAVETVPNKYALLIGNANSKLTDLNVPTSVNDVNALKDSLIHSAGYEADHVTVVTDQTAAGIRKAVADFQAGLPQDATVFLFFSGVGLSLDGHDYLAGTDAEFESDVAKMVPKAELFDTLLQKGAKIFAFYQVDRSPVSGNYFGQERSPVGTISEAMATIAGQKVYSMTEEGKTYGLYAHAMVQILDEFATNKVPISEFCYQVFYRIRRGDVALGGGGSYQTPTLPTVTNMSDNASF